MFWSGSLLFGDLRPAAPMESSQLLQGVLTALTALLLVFSARKSTPLRRRKLLLGAFALVSSAAVIAAALAGFGKAPLPFMLLGFALSGVGSALRLGCEERLSVQGVRRTALCADMAYLLGFVLFIGVLLPPISALLCLALVRFAQWGGSCLGQLAVDALPSAETVTIAILLSLVIALLVIMGSPLSGKLSVASSPAGPLDLDERVCLAAGRYKLSPREQEVLAIWATGRTGAYIEKMLFISKNTVKTHLNHIYAKTNTANREQLLELLDRIDN